MFWLLCLIHEAWILQLFACHLFLCSTVQHMLPCACVAFTCTGSSGGGPSASLQHHCSSSSSGQRTRGSPITQTYFYCKHGRKWPGKFETMKVGFQSDFSKGMYIYIYVYKCTLLANARLLLLTRWLAFRKIGVMWKTTMYHLNYGSEPWLNSRLLGQTCDAVLKEYPLLAAQHVLRKSSFPTRLVSSVVSAAHHVHVLHSIYGLIFYALVFLQTAWQCHQTW